MKFKIGDKVRVLVDSPHYANISKGDILFVVGFHNFGPLLNEDEDAPVDTGWHVDSDQVELVFDEDTHKIQPIKQSSLKVKIKKLHEDAVVPFYAKNGDAGLDLKAVYRYIAGNHVTYTTGLSIEIPDGHAGFIFPRSSIYQKDLVLSNAVGIVDAGFRGEIKVIFNIESDFSPSLYEVGDRVAQLVIMPYPKVEFEVVDELSETERGDGGFGSSGI